MSDVWTPVDPEDPALVEGLARLRERREAVLATGARHAGWKVGFNAPSIWPTLGIRSGVVGFLTEQTRSLDGIVAVPDEKAAAEVEIAFRLARPVAPDATDADARSAIGSIALAFEIVVLGELDIADVLASDVFHHAYVLGDSVPWPADGVARIEIEGRHGDEPLEISAPASGPLEDVASMLRFTAGGAAAIGGSLEAGDLVLSGSLAGLAWVAPGEHLSLRSDLLGDIEVTLRG